MRFTDFEGDELGGLEGDEGSEGALEGALEEEGIGGGAAGGEDLSLEEMMASTDVAPFGAGDRSAGWIERLDNASCIN